MSDYVEAVVAIGTNSQKALAYGWIDEIDLVPITFYIPDHIPPIIRIYEQVFGQKCPVVSDDLMCNLVTEEKRTGPSVDRNEAWNHRNAFHSTLPF